MRIDETLSATQPPPSLKGVGRQARETERQKDRL